MTKRLTNIGGFNTIEQFIEHKLNALGAANKTFGDLFGFMFAERNNTMAELSDGYRIAKTTYGQCASAIRQRARVLSGMISLKRGSMVALAMDNSLDWIELCWAILMCGYRPLLVNLRLPNETIAQLFETYGVELVISDCNQYSINTLMASSIIATGDDIFESDFWGEEIIFMSSGSMGKVKLCAYSAQSFYSQLCNSLDIIKECPRIAAHYNGELKLLVLLPLYHVFGFIAVYLWFGFFSRTFVFLKDLSPATIQYTIKKHKVTHIFAVPLVWQSVYKSAITTIKRRGDASHIKFCRGLRLANSGRLGQRLTHRAMGEVREGMFGDSIRFLISGGGAISRDVLKFFNGVGYHLANGFGMTEAGITSVETSSSPHHLCSGSVGKPFSKLKYALSNSGELMISGDSMASRIMMDGKELPLDDGWLHSSDIAQLTDGRCYLCGRCDDIIVSCGGENLNPQLIEENLFIEGADDICIVELDGQPTLIVSCTSCYTQKRVEELIASARAQLAQLKLDGEIKSIAVTADKLVEPNEFKLIHKNVRRRCQEGKIVLINSNNSKSCTDVLLSELQAGIADCFSEVLKCQKATVALNSHFFGDLGGSSLDYFMLAELIGTKYGVDIKNAGSKSLCTVSEIYDYIINQ